jgi:hypothetical protein
MRIHVQVRIRMPSVSGIFSEGQALAAKKHCVNTVDPLS